MPIRIPVQSVKVTRAGKSVFPKLNQPFDFTAEEIDALTAANPVCLRKPIVEAAAAAESDIAPEQEKPEAKPAAGAKKGAKKTTSDDF